ncbi:proline iminopeptidase-family hydrolase [Candidatus Mycosynbacter amalyticus]|nr:proline iminopeptidase-family hydrolase [Candidatus Mycosynbacter amalyticus]
MTTEENYLTRNGHSTWYQVHGAEQPGTPLIVLHGGPGFPHNALRTHIALAERGYPVVLYDQLGCGKSDRPDDPSLWTVEFFVEELEALRQHLGYEVVNLIGGSWGGSLLFEYALKYPQYVHKLVAHSPLVDTHLWVAEADRLKDELPDGQGVRMRELERRGETEGEEYTRLSDLFDDHFVLRVPKDQDVLDAIAGMGAQVYHTMWGPSEAHATGNLKDWSVLDRLSQISQPTLLVSGRYDEATPRQMQEIVRRIPDIRWELFEHSSHSANLEEPEKFLRVVGEFLGEKGT